MHRRDRAMSMYGPLNRLGGPGRRPTRGPPRVSTGNSIKNNDSTDLNNNSIVTQRCKKVGLPFEKSSNFVQDCEPQPNQTSKIKTRQETLKEFQNQQPTVKEIRQYRNSGNVNSSNQCFTFKQLQQHRVGQPNQTLVTVSDSGASDPHLQPSIAPTPTRQLTDLQLTVTVSRPVRNSSKSTSEQRLTTVAANGRGDRRNYGDDDSENVADVPLIRSISYHNRHALPLVCS